MSSLNQVQLIEDYISGQSSRIIAAKYGLSYSMVRKLLCESGVMRTKHQACEVAQKKGRFGSGLRGKKRPMKQETKDKIGVRRASWGELNAAGVSKKPNGYLEYTRGPHKGRLVHVVKMEQRIGRRIAPDECVHHIDRNRANNSDDNLALLTRSGHARLHRFEDQLAGKRAERDQNGRFS